jgi:DNA-binding response OmpR family regulator
VVDDEASARDTIEALLQADRYRLEFAVDGAAAVERFAREPVDLVLCDVMMPKLDGYEVCRYAKADPRWRFVPIILITALDGRDDLVRGLEAGADDFLSKPIERMVLRAKVRAMLRVRRHYRQLQMPTNVDDLLRARRARVVEAAGLLPREREILDLLLLGRSHEDIGHVLGIAARTVKFHQAKLLAKLGADSRLDLARLFL